MTILLVDFAADRAGDLRNTQPWAEWEEAPSGWPRCEPAWTCRGPVDAVLVWAGKADNREAVLACMEIRDRIEMQGVPLLVVITRYQMDIGNEVRRIVDSDFLITPFEEQNLRRKLAGLCANGSLRGT